MQAVLIAAGRSSRFWPFNEDHKSMAPLMGKPLLQWTLESLAEEGTIEEAIVVHAPSSDIPTRIPSQVGNMSVRFVLQQNPLGTGNALYQARPFVQETFALVWPDMVSGGPIVSSMKEAMERERSDGAIFGAPTDRPWDFGVIESQEGRLVRIVEKPQRGSEPSTTKRVGVELFGADFFDVYNALTRHHETDLADALNEYAASRNVLVYENGEDVPVLKYPWDLFVAQDLLFAHEGGVRVEGAFISESAQLEGDIYIGAGSRIGEGVHLRGPLSIGENAIIEEGSILSHCIIGDEAIIHGASLQDSIVAQECSFASGFHTVSRRDDGKPVQASVKGAYIDTGRTNLGAMIGAHTSFEAQSSTEPGVLVGREVAIGAGVAVSENVEDGEEISPRIADE